MIANITQGKTVQGIFDYNDKKVEKGEARFLFANVFDGRASTAAYFIRHLGEASSRKDRFFHVSLNFPKSDKDLLSKENLRAIARDYLSRLGFGNDHPFTLYEHTDMGHPHVHIVTSKILPNGKCLNDSHLFRRSQAITRKLELEYGLTKVPSVKQSQKVRGPGLAKNMEEAIDRIIEDKKPVNIKELAEHLAMAQLGIGITEVEKEVGGKKEKKGYVLHRNSPMRERTDTGITASQMEIAPKIEKALAKNARKDPRKKEIIRYIDSLLKGKDQLNIGEFGEKLRQRNIVFHHKLDSKGKLVGASFTDLRTNRKWSGEKLGKNYRAGQLAAVLTTGASKDNPVQITQKAIAPIKEKLLKSDSNTILRNLVLLGFRTAIDGKRLSVSDARNPKGEGFIHLCEFDHKINQNITKSYARSLNINFLNNFNPGPFLKNREALMLDRPLNTLQKTYIPIKTSPNIHTPGGSASIKASPTYNPDEHRIEDIDKKKRKKRGKGI